MRGLAAAILARAREVEQLLTIHNMYVEVSSGLIKGIQEATYSSVSLGSPSSRVDSGCSSRLFSGSAGVNLSTLPLQLQVLSGPLCGITV